MAPLPDLLAYSAFAAIAVQLAAIDLVDLRPPTPLIWPTALSRAAAGAVGLVALYLAIAVASRRGLGAGDARLAAPVGLMLAWHSWPTLIAGTVLGFLFDMPDGLRATAACRE